MTATRTPPVRTAIERQPASVSPEAPLFRRGVMPVRIAGLSTPITLRVLLVTGALAVAALAVAWWNMISGSAALTAADALAALLGQTDEATARIVLEWRAPRVIFTLLGGAALAVAGAVFQSQTRNPLGSPDIIGFSTGAYTGALVVATLGWTGVWFTPIGAVAGGLGTGVLVNLLAWKGGVSGLRIIIVGIGVSIFLGSVNTYLITVLDLEIAMAVATWGAGSVNTIGWAHVLPLLVALAITLPLMLARAADMRLMEMGDDAAAGLGVRLERVRLVQFLCGIVLVAVVTAAAGPIAFVALVAPQLALRLTASPSVQLVPAAAMGALLLTSADALARAAFLPVALPVGVITLVLGGTYLVWLLISLSRSRKVQS
ncbi:FecCD family ABC transporter permease [Bogoriella caseilytica]|uniref:Iron complex transport system permease protein n=1 Tax=Bogoriella caseilytica TaxID=56055 RepID=A0A3N2BDZ5_9MICO|nr:iron chelate uptake ABC transporter family permease subunit [Bogoriella caseilytica]ROR73471.1 iron complex transport system permease protein [Bogoriella caseilytica]